MNGETLRRKVTIRNPQGLHMRPASAFAQLAAKYQSTVTVWKETQGVSGRSLMELLLLAAMPGTELIVEVSGPDAQAAVDALAELLASPDVEESPDPSPQRHEDTKEE
jgi:phosphocarrier protein